jgi:hypothetical protein
VAGCFFVQGKETKCSGEPRGASVLTWPLPLAGVRSLSILLDLDRVRGAALEECGSRFFLVKEV